MLQIPPQKRPYSSDEAIGPKPPTREGMLPRMKVLLRANAHPPARGGTAGLDLMSYTKGVYPPAQGRQIHVLGKDFASQGLSARTGAAGWRSIFARRCSRFIRPHRGGRLLHLPILNYVRNSTTFLASDPASLRIHRKTPTDSFKRKKAKTRG